LGDEGTTFTGFSIFHNSPQTTGLYHCPVIEIVDEKKVTEDIEELGSGKCFKVVSVKFDKAGHQAGEDYINESYFKIPV
jgi:hypothetical protein